MTNVRHLGRIIITLVCISGMHMAMSHYLPKPLASSVYNKPKTIAQWHSDIREQHKQLTNPASYRKVKYKHRKQNPSVNGISGEIAIKTNLPWINRNSSSISPATQYIYKAFRASSPKATRLAGAPLLPMFPETCPWLRSLARGSKIHPS